MYGRMHWSRRTRLRRQTAANASAPGAGKPLNDLSQKPKSCMGCAMPACLESAACTSSPSSPPPYMKRIARAFRFPFSLLSLSIKGQFPRGNRPFVGGLGGRENSLPLSILRTQNGFLTSCVLKSTNYRKFIETIICFAYNDIIRKR